MASISELLPGRGRRRRPAPDGEQTEDRRLGREVALAWLHLAVLWAFAIAKPLFDVLSDSPEFFVARGNTRGDILLFAFGLVLLAPTVLVLVEALFARVPHVRRGLHLLFVAALAGAFVLQLLNAALGGSSALLLLVALAVGVAAAVAYALTRLVPTVLTVLGPAPILFLALFLLFSPVSKLILPQESVKAARSDVSSRTPVVLVVMDEFDPNMLMNARQRVDRTRYPNFAALARTATWYRNATTVASQTTDAVPGVLSSTVPRGDALPVAADYPNTVFTLLENSHSMQVLETATELCSEQLCGARARESKQKRLGSLVSDLGVVSLHLLLPERLRSGLPAVDRTFGDFRGGGRDRVAAGKPAKTAKEVPSEFFQSRTSAVDALIAGIGPEDRRPGFHFLHAAFPHVPWQYLPSGQQYLVNGPETPGLVEERWAKQPFPARLGLQRHLLQVGYTDRLVGRIVGRLRRAGLFDRAMVIFTADHGVSFRPGQSRRVIVRQTASDLAAVPLFIKYPKQKQGWIDTSMVRNIDIVPTIAQELGARLPWRADGRPIQGGGRRDGQVKVFNGATNKNITLSFTDFVRERSAGLRRMIGFFGADDGGAGLYASGPDRDLLDRPVGRLTVAAGSGARVDLDSTELLASFRPDVPTVPSFITGKIEGGATQDADRLAVAVNGMVRGVSVAFRDENDLRLAAMVPANSFRRGSNVVDVFAVEGEGAGRRLVRLQTERPGSYRLVERGGKTLIVSAGREIPVEKGRLEGFIDELERDATTFRAGGWAVDRKARSAVDTLVVFEGTRFLTNGGPTLPRPDIAANIPGITGKRPGFRLNPSAEGVELDKVRVFAISGGVASELPRFKP